jgi:enoyl-CoA hydratase/carnithine racemase
MNDIEISVDDGIARLTLNRPKALNALSLSMIRDITKALVAWQADTSIAQVLMRGRSKQGDFGVFCAGGDIRYFYEAVQATNGRPIAPETPASPVLDRASLEDFFTEEYRLNHLIHHYSKPVWALMDGVVMGGGMGLSQGAGLRIVTERTKMAMPETAIGLFPDVGGGYFLSRSADAAQGVGEYLALTGCTLSGTEAVGLGLADVCIASEHLADIWLKPQSWDKTALSRCGLGVRVLPFLADIQAHFSLPTVEAIANALRSDPNEWAQLAFQKLQKNSPLMLAVTLIQVRKARSMSLADALRMERDMVHRCFAGTPEQHSDTVEGIRALVIDKDHQPRWQPATQNGVNRDEVGKFFVSPWPAAEHPLRGL